VLAWIVFPVLVAVIAFAGTGLSRYGDILAEKWGLGRTWVGFILLATVTSLPELVTGLSSVTVADAPDLAVGDVLGSCAFNLLIFAMLDLQEGGKALSSRASVGHVLSAAFGILLLSVISLSLVAGNRIVLPSLGWVGIPSVAILGIYLVAAKVVYSYEKRQIAGFVREIAEELHYRGVTAGRAMTMYGVHAALVVGAAGALPWAGAEIARSTGLGQTFVGSAFLAVATSLPEVVVSLAAARIGAVDLAIGNLLGSNIFNACILAVDDLFYAPGPIYGAVTASHAIPALTAIAMTGAAVAGLVYRAEKKRFPLAWDSVAMVLAYILGLALLYSVR
jgi:cation:H+ antiporter